MQYRKNKKGQDISLLGYGCMRFTTKAGRIDIDKAEKEILAAVDAGVNYFDTAYLYSGSEAALGEIVEKNGLRQKINIATKLPQYLVSNIAAVERIFNEELARLRTDYVDYYLMHMLTDFAQWERLKAMGIEEWIAQKKASGQIRNIGFSFHGNTAMFKKILDDYDWEFCLVQYNYLDKVSQAGEEGVKAAAAKGIPVMIMEPLRGGKLVGLLPESAKKMIASNARGWSAAEWGFRWLCDFPQIATVLSGVTNYEQTEDNLAIFDRCTVGAMTDEEKDLMVRVRKAYESRTKVGCTGCRYCMPCPNDVEIPRIFSIWNNKFQFGEPMKGNWDYKRRIDEGHDASKCVECGACESVCPQQLNIIELLKQADAEMRA